MMLPEIEPTGEDIRVEAKRRVDARHRGCVSPLPEVLADEYEREELYVASLDRQFPWSEVVTIPDTRTDAQRKRDAEDGMTPPHSTFGAPRIPDIPIIRHPAEVAEDPRVASEPGGELS